MSKNLKETATNIFKQSNRNPAIYSIFIAIFGCAFFVYEFFNTFSFNLNTPIENWVATASYFNNVFSPILLFVSILLLYRTWKDSKAALELQKMELEETKKVLLQQVDLQNIPIVQQSILSLVDDLNIYLNKEITLCIDNEKHTITTMKPREGSMDKLYCINKLIIEYYTKIALDKNNKVTNSYRNILNSGNLSFPETELKALSLLLKAIDKSEKKEFIEISLFSKFDLRVWLFFSYKLYSLKGKKRKYGNGYDYDEMFEVIATLTYKRLKKSSWLSSLPTAFRHELELKEIK